LEVGVDAPLWQSISLVHWLNAKHYKLFFFFLGATQNPKSLGIIGLNRYLYCYLISGKQNSRWYPHNSTNRVWVNGQRYDCCLFLLFELKGFK